MEKKISLIVIIIILAILALTFSKYMGLFSAFVGVINDLKVSYQYLNDKCIVRLEKISTGTTTWVGAYDINTSGQKNADTAKKIGWVDDIEYLILIELLANNPPSPSCTLISIQNTPADTNCDGSVDRTELGVYIAKWINNEVSREDLGQAIVAWIDSGE